MAEWHFSKPRIPARAVIIAIAALLVPFVNTSFYANAAGPAGALLWLLALVPAFLLAYYRGWRGASTALAAGMAVLSSAVWIALLRGGELGDSLLLPVVAAYIAIALATGFLSERMHANRADAELIALTDDLTGLPNRRRARMQLERAAVAAQSQPGQRLTIILFDLDHFKGYNDRLGHTSGDALLRVFGAVLRDAVGEHGMAARYGGEEFLAILSDCDDAGAAAVAERVRASLRQSQQSDEPITVSAGIGVYGGSINTANDLIICADRALYEAKKQGRDRVCVGTELQAASG